MALNAPSRRRSRILQANRRAVGGGRKRCKKGKNCSAACINPNMECLVGLPVPVSTATSKVSQFLMTQTRGKSGVIRPQPAVNPELRAKGDALLRELRSASPKAAMGAPLASAATGGTGQEWSARFSGRNAGLDAELSSLSAKINKLPPDQQAYWNEQINKQMNPKLASRNGTPYTPERTDRSLTSQAKAWNYLVENGQPKELMNRIGEKRPAPQGMIPDVTSSGQRKWISPEDGLKYSLNRGNWRQNRVSKADTDRRLPDITSFRKEQQGKGQEWPIQKLPARENLPKTVDEILKGLSASEKNSIVFNGLDATGNEGIKLRKYYNDNPAEKEARLREVVQRWHEQGGRSGVSGKPVALPGLDPKPGEERSSVDHFKPISTSRGKDLPANAIRNIADNYKNFLIAEEGPNSQRGARTWDSWLDRRENEGAPKVSKVSRTPKATKEKAEDTNYDKWNEIKRGNYGKINVSPDGNRAVKTLLTGPDGKQGEFGPHEVELATKMGQLGHSPKVYKTTDKTMEMDKAKGDTLWKGYTRGENEPAMNAAQATKAAAAIRDLHKLGFYHGDNHALQYLVDGDNVKMVDFGLSGPISGNPVRVMQDLAKIGSLVKWDNPELAGNPYVQIVNRHLPAYRAVKGTSKAAKAEKERIAQAYLRDLNNLPSSGAKAPAKPSTGAPIKLNEKQTERALSEERMVNKRINRKLGGSPFEEADPSSEKYKQNIEQLKPLMDLAPKQKSAIGLYGENVQEHYKAVNTMLRTGKGSGDEQTDNMSRFIVKHLSPALESLPPVKGELQRAVSGDFATQLSRLKPGEIIQDNGYGSYTNQPRTLNQFIKSGAENAVIRINSKTARNVSPVMEYDEGEHLSLPGTKYRLVSVDPQGFTSSKVEKPVTTYTFEEVE